MMLLRKLLSLNNYNAEQQIHFVKKLVLHGLAFVAEPDLYSKKSRKPGVIYPGDVITSAEADNLLDRREFADLATGNTWLQQKQAAITAKDKKPSTLPEPNPYTNAITRISLRKLLSQEYTEEGQIDFVKKFILDGTTLRFDPEPDLYLNRFTDKNADAFLDSYHFDTEEKGVAWLKRVELQIAQAPKAESDESDLSSADDSDSSNEDDEPSVSPSNANAEKKSRASHTLSTSQAIGRFGIMPAKESTTPLNNQQQKVEPPTSSICTLL